MEQAATTAKSKMEGLKSDLSAYQSLAEKTFDPALLGGYNNQIKNLQNAISRLGKEAEITAEDTQQIAKEGVSGLNALGGATVSASMKFQQMRSGISAARDGLMGFAIGGQAGERALMAMGHHINSLVNETGSFGGAMKAMGAALIGPGGLILALTAAFELFQHFSKAESEAYDAANKFTSAADAQKAVFQNLDSSYGEAVKDVYELTENVKLAKEGFISKSEVVKEYNDTIGKTMGTVKSLDEVEKKLVGGTADYLKMMYYKAVALTAYKEASDKAVEAAKAQKASDEASAGLGSKTVNVLRRTVVAAGMGNVIGLSEADKKQAADAETDRQKQVASFKKDEQDLLNIANDYQSKSASISAKNKWNFLPDQEAKVKKAKEGFAIIEAELTKLRTELETALMTNQPPTVLNNFAKQIEVLEAKLDALKAKMLKVFFPHLNDEIPVQDPSVAKTTSQNSIQNINSPFDNATGQNVQTPLKSEAISGDDVAKAVADHKKETDAIWESYMATRRYNAENKLASQTLKELTRTIGTGLMNAFQQALAGTESFVSAMGHFLLQLIEKLIAAAAAAAILAVLLSATGFGGAASGIGGFKSIFGQLSGLSGLATGAASSGGGGGTAKGFATGGIFTQPTVGLFGEAGPEAIVTPEHLADFAGMKQNTKSEPQTLSMKLQGSDMLLFLNRANKTKSRTS